MYFPEWVLIKINWVLLPVVAALTFYNVKDGGGDNSDKNGDDNLYI